MWDVGRGRDRGSSMVENGNRGEVEIRGPCLAGSPLPTRRMALLNDSRRSPKSEHLGRLRQYGCGNN